MIVRSSALFIPPGHPTESRVRETAEIVNPAYLEHEQMVRAGVRSRMSQKPPRMLKVWREIPAGHPWAGGTMAPRVWEPGDLRLRRDLRADVHDHFAQPAVDGLSLADGFALRDYQQEAVDTVERAECGVVVMPCGAGKTSTGVGIVERLKLRTLILVHTKDLARQWVERIAGVDGVPGQLVGATLGTVGGGVPRTDEGADVVVATVQTLTEWPWGELYEWGKGFGLVIMDEAHHAPAETFLRVLYGLPARYRVGLTATPDREDGLGSLLWAAFGDVVYRVDRDELVAAGRIRPASLHVHQTGISVATHELRDHPKAKWVPISGAEARAVRAGKSGDWPKVRPRRWDAIVRDIVTSEPRNALIRAIAAERVEQGHSGIILSARVQHCKDLAKQLTAEGVPAAALAGTQSQSAVSRILHRARTGEVKVLVGTTKADEGLDVPCLSFGILATRTKKFGRLTQRIGRIERPEGLPPEWHDLVDDTISDKRALAERMKLYRALKLEGAQWKRRRAA